MKTNKLLLKTTLWLALMLFGQTAWATDWDSKTSGTTKTLRGITFSNDTTAFSAGLSGTILKSSDSGNTWNTISSGITTDLFSIDFTTDSIGYAVGASGVVLKTIDAGNTWTKLTTGTLATLRKVTFINKYIGYAVGLSGILIKTIDAGATWTILSTGKTTDFYSVFFKDELNGYICGASGVFINTTDGGATWKNVSLGITTTASLFSIVFTDTNTGYLAGWTSGILKTTDGGATWKQLLTSYSSLNLNSLFFTSSTTGYVVGTSVLKQTTDAGVTWNDMTFPTSAVYLRQIEFNSKGSALIVGDAGIIIKQAPLFATPSSSSISSEAQSINSVVNTSDQTLSWTASSSASWLTLNSTSGTGIHTLTLSATKNIKTTTRTGTITLTGSDGTTNPITVNQAAASNPLSISTTSISIGLNAKDSVVTLTSISGNYWTLSSSASWLSTDVTSGTGTGTFTIKADVNNTINLRTGIITVTDTLSGGTISITVSQMGTAFFSTLSTIKLPIGVATTYITAKSNVSWTLSSADSWVTLGTTSGTGSQKIALTSQNNSSISRTTKLTFTITTSNTGLPSTYSVFVVQDGIQTPWTQIKTNVNGIFYGLCHTNDTTAYAVGASGIIAKSIDAGTTWKTQISGKTTNLRAISFPTDSTGYIAGLSGIILKSTDAGNTWVSQTSNTSYDLYGISFLNKNTGVACGGSKYTNCVILYTSDGGTTWKTSTLPNSTIVAFNGIEFSKDSVAYVAGLKGVVYKSTDLGATWTNVSCPTSLQFMSIKVIDKNTVLAGSTSVAKTVNGGTTWTTTALPASDYAYGIGIANDTTLYACGSYIYKSINKGTSWSKIQSNSSIFNSISLRNQYNGIMVGNGIYKFASFSLSSTNLTTSALAKDTTVSIIPLGNAVDWTASADSSWISVNKLDNQTLKISVASNLGIDLRVGTITVTAKDGTNHTYTIAQNGISLSVSATTLTLGSAENSNTTFAIAATTGWAVKSSDTWLAPNITSGSGNATVSLTAKENTSLSSRGATVTVSNSLLGDKIITVTQAGVAPKVELSKISVGFTTPAIKADTLAVTSNTSWTASTTAPWITLSQSVTSGNGSLIVTVGINTSVTARVDTVYVTASGVNTIKLVVSQIGANPVVSLSAKNVSYTYSAISAIVPVTANTTFAATTAASWIQVSNLTASSFSISLLENTTLTNRIDTVSVSVTGGNTAKIAIIQGAAKGSYASISCTRDNTIIQTSDGSLGNGKGAIYIGRTNQGTGISIRRGLIYFDIATNVPTNAVIDSVRLSMYEIGVVKDAAINLHKVLTDWSEGTSFFDGGKGAPVTIGDVSWLHSSYPDKFWSTPGGDFDVTVSATKNALVLMPSGSYRSTYASSIMASEVQNWLSNPTNNYGWLLQGDETVAGNAEVFRSKDGSDYATNQPVLKVYYSTSPTTGTSALVQSNFSVYPNPASSYTTVYLSETNIEPIRIYNLCGSLIKTVSHGVEKQVDINLSDVQTGIYLIKVGTQTAKLVVK